jgi:hypothetical protein
VSDLQPLALDLPAETAVPARQAPPASLTLGHVLTVMGADYDPKVRLEDVHVLRHAFRRRDDRGLRGPQDLTEERVLAYTREQNVSTRSFPADPPRYWVILVADGQRRSRLWGTYENHGEVAAERTEANRYFDLRPAGFLAPLKGRLVVEWDNPRIWHRKASSDSAARMPATVVAERFFEELPRVPEGTWRASRQEMSALGVHQPTTGGISGTNAEGADPVVVSGGYEDDEGFGDEVIYAGAGGIDPNTGKQIADLPEGSRTPKTSAGMVTRTIRSTAVSRAVKRFYQDHCQVCGLRLDIPGGSISEGAHIRALGKPHHGPDMPENVLCLCPNHHSLFDEGGIYITDDLTVTDHLGQVIGPLHRHARHDIGAEYLRYHRELWGHR